MKEKNPFSEVSIALRIAFVEWNWFPVMTIRSIFSFAPSATRKVTRRAPSESSETDASTDASINPLFWHTSVNLFTDSFTFSSWKRDRSLTVTAARRSVVSTSLFPSICTAADDRLLDDDHGEAIPARDLLRVERHVAEIPHPVDRLDVLPDLLQVQLLSDLRPHRLPDGVRRDAARPPHLDRDHPEPVRRHGPGADREEGRAQARQARMVDFPLTRRSSRRRSGSPGEGGTRPGRCASPSAGTGPATG